MALVNIDPCTSTAVILDTWTSKANASYVAGAGRNGGGALRINGGNVMKGITAIAECWRGFALSFASQPSGSAVTIARVSDSGTTQVELDLLSTGFLQWFRNVTAIGSPSTVQLVAGVKYHFRLHIIVDPSGGLVELYLNGHAAPIMSFSGNTRNSANSSFNQLQLFAPSSVNFDFSDIWDISTTGAPAGDLGDVLVGEATITGDSGTPSKNQFSPTPSQSTGSHHLNVVDNSDTTYLADTVVGHVERFPFSLPSSIAPKLLATRAKAVLDDAGPRSIGVGFSSGGTDSLGSDFSVPSSAGWSPYTVLVNDPGTGSAWGSNPSAEALVEITA